MIHTFKLCNSQFLKKLIYLNRKKTLLQSREESSLQQERKRINSSFTISPGWATPSAYSAVPGVLFRMDIGMLIITKACKYSFYRLVR